MNKHDLTGADIYAKEKNRLQLKEGLKCAAIIWFVIGFAGWITHLLGA